MSAQSDSRRLAVPKFNGKDYPVWKHRISLVLREADVWDVVVQGTQLATIDEASDGPDGWVSWNAVKKDIKARRIITSGLIDEHVVLTMSCTTAKTMWELLETINEKSGTSNRLFLRQRFFKLKMDEASTMLDHIAALETLSRQIEAAGSRLEEEDIVMTLFGSLPDRYSTIVTALEARDGALSLTSVTAKLLHEEAKQQSTSASSDANLDTVNALFAGKPHSDQRRGKPQRSMKNDKCLYCEKKGHWKRNCRKFLSNKRNESVTRRAQYRPAVDEGADAREGPAEIFLADTWKNNKSEERFSWLHADWIMDSGASSHISNNLSLFESIDYTRQKDVMVGDGRVFRCKGIGSVSVVLNVHGNGTTAMIKDVWYIPEISCNLISVPQLINKGLKVQFGTSGCKVFNKSGLVIAAAHLRANLWKLPTHVVPSSTEKLLTILQSESSEIWHRRLGHVNRDVIARMATRGLIQEATASTTPCEPCVMGKQRRRSFKKSVSKTAQLLALVHSDLCGPMNVESKGGAQYFALFVDDYSRFTFVHFLKNKSDVQNAFKMFMAFAEKQFGHSLRRLRTDNGGEYTNDSFEQFLSLRGIVHESSVPYTPQQNGVAERMNRTVTEMARTMLLQSTFDESFRAEAISTAVYLRNRVPSSSIDNQVPYERLYGRASHLNHLRVFGCLSFVKRLDPSVRKWNSRAQKCLLLGYSPRSKAYRLWSLEKNCIVEAINVSFDEHSIEREERNVGAKNMPKSASEEIVWRPGMGMEEVQAPEVDIHDIDALSAEDLQAITHYPAASEPEESEANGTLRTERRYPLRTRAVTRRYDPNLSENEHVNLVQSAEPTSLEEALSSVDESRWRRALDEEMTSLMNNRTWRLVKLPVGRKAVDCKWVFKHKLDVHGKVQRFKARLVAKGFLQREGVDYFDTFAPVCKFTSLRCVLGIGAMLDFGIYQMDVKTAFLNGELQEEVYMRQPPGYENSQTHLVCRLQKALYGLKQAPRAWYAKLSGFLADIGFTSLESDHGSFVRENGGERQYILVYVDDLVIAARTLHEVVDIKTRLSAVINMSDLGEIGQCLGLEIKRNRKVRTITLSQSHYIERILGRFGMQHSRPPSTPLDAGLALATPERDKEDKELKEKSEKLVGSVMYAMLGTRADISFAVSPRSRSTANPHSRHWKAAKHLLRYLRGTSDMVLVLGGCNDSNLNEALNIEGFCDSDWASDKTDRRSTSGYMFQINGFTVAWQTKKQTTVALSTVEAEYLALSSAVKEAIWLRLLFKELGFIQKGPTVIWEDNQGCSALGKNPKFHQRAKHIDIRHHFIREKVAHEVIALKYIPTDKTPADGLTKSLRATAHGHFIGGMGLQSAQNLM